MVRALAAYDRYPCGSRLPVPTLVVIGFVGREVADASTPGNAMTLRVKQRIRRQTHTSSMLRF